MINAVPPALIFILGALFIPLFRGKLKNAYLLLLPVIGFINLLNIPEGIHFAVRFLDYELIFGRMDRLSLLFGYAFHLISFIAILYAIHVKDNMQHVSALLYAGASLGVIFAGDLFSLFIFWEIMAVTATFLIWARRTNKAIAAGFRFLLVHIFGGICLLAGIIVQLYTTGSIEFGYIGLNSVASYLIFLGFGINCAWPLLHSWLPDAYPESTVTGTVFLGVFTTKCAVYALARGFPGTEILIWIGAIMTAFPIFFAVIENNLRRILSFSIINQVGFMVVGIGIGTQLALNGAVAHAFANILFKSLLFMAMGAVLYRTGKINCTDLGGLYKSMPITCILCIVGNASISAFPLFTAFATKTLIMEAVAREHLTIIWFMLLIASVGVLEHAGIKIPFFAFFSHDSGIRVKEAPLNMLLAMGITAFLCIGIGVFPGTLYSLLPYPVDYQPYTLAHVMSQLQVLLFAILAFCLLLLSGIYPSERRAVNLDADWFYRKGGGAVLHFCNVSLNNFRLSIQRSASQAVDFIRKLGADPILIPEFTIRYTHLKLSKALLPITNPPHAKERLAEIEFNFNRFREITKSGRKYGTDMPPRPMGLGVLFAFILMLFYLVFYLLR
jgi:multicomponent Na+:H+ antiporter subunit D